MQRNRDWTRLVALVGLISLTGCEYVLLDSEEKINAAVPVPQTVEAAMSDLLKNSPDNLRKRIEGEYAAKLKLRALNCAKGYAPSRLASLETVRKELTDRSCFTSTDAGIAQWIGMRRVAAMLAEPPLKPVPAVAPKFIVGDAFIQSVQFADNAGVAVFLTQQSLQAVDIASGSTFFKEPRSNEQLGLLSPNGRLIITSAENKVKVRNTESGEVILEVPKARAHAFQWIDKQAALYNHADSSKTFLLDFSKGEEFPVPEFQGSFSRVINVDGTDNQFIVGTYRTVAKATIERSSQETKVKLIDEKPLSGTSWALNTSGLTADGSLWFNGSKDLTLLSVGTLEQDRITFEPLHVQTAVATPDPDKLLLTGFIRGGHGVRTYVFSLSGRTMAPVDRTQLVSERLLYIPALKKQAAISDSKIVVLDDLPLSEPVELTKFIADATEEANARKLEEFQRAELYQQGAPMAPSVSAYGASRAGWETAGSRIPAQFADLAKDAQIESIGVYQGPRSSARSGNASEAGQVEVKVRKAPKPILLVLSSYEAVRWNLSVEPGARLAGVLVSGYKSSQVTGNGAARVMMIGSNHAYKLDSNEYNALNTHVQRLTGKQIYYFQGRYEGTSFSVGGA